MRREDEGGSTRTLAFVVMPDHIHWLVELVGARSLSRTINTVKSFSARAYNRLADRQGQVWQNGFYDRAIRRDDDLTGVARYIVANPLRAGLVATLRDYPLWDSVWLNRTDGLD